MGSGHGDCPAQNAILASSGRWRLWFGSATPRQTADGKESKTTLTFAQKGTHVTGVKYDDVSVYDRVLRLTPGDVKLTRIATIAAPPR
jgi:hypothetical protein